MIYPYFSTCSFTFPLFLCDHISFYILPYSNQTADMELVLESHQRSGESEEQAPPPSYYAAIHSNVKSTGFTDRQEQAPSTNWFVCDSTEPSTWQLLASGPLMSNVTAPDNDTIAYKRHYRILYPPNKYEDVYLHRPSWTSQAAAFPLYHVEVYSGRKRYNPEPIVILGPPQDESCSLTTEAKSLLFLHSSRVISAVEGQVADMTRQATFAEMEFFGCDWTCKTAAAIQDMRTMILNAKEECAKSFDLVHGLEVFSTYVNGGVQEHVSASLRRSCEEVSLELGRLRL